MDVNNLHSWTTLQKLTVNNFKWIEDNSQFNEGFIKSYKEESYKGYFLEVDVQYCEKLNELLMIYHFYLRELKLKKSKSF